VGLDNSSCCSSSCSQAFVVAVVFVVAGYLLGIFMDLCHQEEMFQQLDGVNLKKGPWTSAEDAILVSYVSKHGEGNWNSVQKHSGLFRCGKSCRLRWANHLRPNLKKGAFSPDEERTILDLHSKFGNKWARMAAQLPGRTDNEIKNYWNTRIKRRLRAGLPAYPLDMTKHVSSSMPPQYYCEQEDGRDNMGIRRTDLETKFTSSASLGDHKSCQLSSLHGGCENRNFYAITSISDLPFTSVVANQGLGVVGKGIGNPLPQVKRVRHSLCGGADGSGGSVSFSQLSDGSGKTLQPELYTEAGRACTHNSTKMAMMSVFADEPDPYIAPYDGTKGLMGMPFCSFAPNASLKLELPLSQSAESADSVGTLQSAIMSPLMSLSLSSQLLSEADSFGSNASNFLEALMKEAHPTEGLDQVGRTDLIDQLLVLTSGNISADIAALLMGTDNSSWGEDINPMATVETCDSSYQENISLNCCNDSVKEPATSPLLQSAVPPSLSASQVAGPRVAEMSAEVPLGESTDDEFLTILASSDTMPQWYIPPEDYSVGSIACTSLVDVIDNEASCEVAVELDYQVPGLTGPNHHSELNTSPWNVTSSAVAIQENFLLSKGHKSFLESR